MFTGLIKQTSVLKKLSTLNGGKLLEIHSGSEFLKDVLVDDSIAVNGVCLTVTELKENSFLAHAVDTSFTKTNFKYLKIGDSLNLEKALTLNSKLGGHLVSGHVNAVGEVKNLKNTGLYHLIDISLENDLLRYCVNEGSIAINGVSLTIYKIFNDYSVIRVSVIPHTWKQTNLSSVHIGSPVNIEVDQLCKMVDRLINFDKKNKTLQSYREFLDE